MPGDFNTIRNHTLFEQVRVRVMERQLSMDPKQAFASANPGFLAELVDPMGPWRGREEVRMEIPGVAEDAVAVDPVDHVTLGSTDMGHIALEPGILVSGKAQMVGPDDFRYGMTPAQAAERVARPVIDWNQKVAKNLFDVVTQGAFSDGSNDFSDNFAPTYTVDKTAQTVAQPLATQSASVAAAVVANSTQTFAHWPLADGTLASAGHDHLLPTQGASWTETLADTARDLILEHPNMGMVKAFVGSNVAADVVAALKSGYGAIESRVPLVGGSQGGTAGGFGEQQMITQPIGDVRYVHVTNMPDDIAVYCAINRRPAYMSAGALGEGGQELHEAGWATRPDDETGFRKFGYRRYVSMGIKDPLAIAVAEYTA